MNTRVVLVLDRNIASRERLMIRRLRPLLKEEGVEITPAIPADAQLLFDDPAYVDAVPYRPKGLGVTRARRAADLFDRLSLRSERLGAVHALGPGGFRLATELAGLTQATLCLEAHRPGDLRAVRWVPSVLRDRCDWTLLTPGEPLSRMATREGLSASLVRVVPWGVIAGPERVDRPGADEMVAVAVAGNGDDPRAMHAALQGLADASRNTDRLLVLLDAHAARRAGLWSTVRARKLESSLTLVPLMQGQRDLVLHADLFVLPEATGVHATLPLDFFASGVCGVLARDPLVPWQSDARLATLLESPAQSDWARTIEALINNPAERRSRGEAARDGVKASNRLTSHAAALLRVYDWASRRDAIRMTREAETSETRA